MESTLNYKYIFSIKNVNDIFVTIQGVFSFGFMHLSIQVLLSTISPLPTSSQNGLWT